MEENGSVMRWMEKRQELCIEAMGKMEFDYPAALARQKEMIAEALAFWKFVLWHFARHHELIDRREFLLKFAYHENIYLADVAKMAALPISVWRKVLWKYNIDFVSMESFLRRLEPEGRQGLAENFSDLFEKNEIPRVFGKIERLWKRLKFQQITVEKLLSERDGYEMRSERKAAWAYNLLGLDFGFNAYPNGLTDDYKIVEPSPWRLVSFSDNKIKDFVVNMEFGKYAWLYITARCNYVWFPNRDIKLKSHICPGFWYTFLIHALFWIVSPMLCVTFLGNVAASHTITWSNAIFFGLPGLFTPLWCLVAGIKLAVRCMFSEDGRELLTYALAAVVVIFMTAGCMFIAYKFYFVALPELFNGYLIPLAYFMATFYYLGHGVSLQKKSFSWPDWNKLPKWFRLAMPAMLIVLIGQFLYWLTQKHFWAQAWRVIVIIFNWVVELLVDAGRWLIKFIPAALLWVWHLLTTIALVIAAFLKAYGLMLLALIFLPVMFLAVFLWFPELAEKRKWDMRKIDRFYDIFARISAYGSLLTLFASLLMAAYVSIKGAGAFYEMFSVAPIVPIGFFVFSMAACLVVYMTWEKRNPLAQEIQYEVKRAGYGRSERDGIEWKYLRNNQWWLDLSAGDRYRQLDRTVRVLRAYLHDNYYKGYHVLLPIMDDSVLSYLEKNKGKVKVGWGHDFSLGMLQKLCDGMKFNDAKKAVSRELERRARRDRNIALFFRVCFFWLIAAWFIVRACFLILRKAWEFAFTTKRLYDFFKKQCPSIMQPGKVS